MPFEEKSKTNLPCDNLKYYRQRKQMTTRQLAEKLDIAPETVVMYENGKHPIPYDVAIKLADVLKIEAALFYDDFSRFLAVPYTEALKSVRMDLGLSQKAFAEQIEVIPSYYYKLEEGNRRPSRKVYQKIYAARCPVGAIFKADNKMKVSAPESDDYIDLPINYENLVKHKYFVQEADKIYWNHQFQKESDRIMEEIYEKISHYDGRSMVPNVLVRNLIIALNHECAISRAGDIYTKMDAVYSSKIKPKCSGVVEIEFGRNTLEASRGILDDIAVMHSRNNLGKKDNAALVVCLSFPNKRQGYFQVIKDIHRVLDLKIQTISLGALLLLVWNRAAVNFLSREFYVDFDNLSIRGITEFRLNRHVLLSEGKLGILEPEK